MSYFLGKNLKIYSKRIALAILLAVLFIPFIPTDIRSLETPVEEALSQAPQCLFTQTNIKAVTPALNRTKVGWAESFDFQYVIALKNDQASQAIIDQCRVSQPSKPFVLLMSDSTRSSTYPGGLVINGQFYDEKDSNGNVIESGYAFRYTLTIKDLAPQKPQPQPGDCQILPCDSEGLQSAYIWVYNDNRTTYLPNYGFIKYGAEPIAETPTTLPSLPGGLNPNQTPPTSGTPKTVDYTQVPVTIKPNSAGKGLRSKYRVIWGQQEMHFGVTAGLDGVHTEWGDSSKTISPGDSFKLPDKDDGWGYSTDATYSGMSVYFNFAEDYNKLAANQKVGCAAGLIDTDCTGVVFRAYDSSQYGAGALLQRGPADFDPKLAPKAWQKIPQPSADIQANGNGGKPLGTVQFVALPAFIGGNYNLGGPVPAAAIIVIAAGSGAVKPFNVEVFANENDIKAACKEDLKAAGKNESEQSQCDNLAFAQYASADPITQTTSSTESSDKGVVGDLFSFLRQVIAYIVLVLTGIIYYIFSAILVPVIVAILGIHPYKDSFVNFIYPGWLILRNISNIFFIVALLWIGLRTIFQMEDATKSRTFILRLILAALLVNFSLVIGQAIVGIADTVQSQFLPANSKVVETLGFKLMVDPIITFRGTEGGGQDNYGLTEGGNFTTEGLASDLPKAVILLVLAISAFFAFVALIAFLIVRVVALWLLYMLSPIAYVGFILPTTSGMAKQWWGNFIKYAFAVPIMAFFLNIAALLAVTMARPTGDSVQTGNSNTTILWGLINTGSIASEFVSFATTVLSHFLVLVFMYGGMWFALRYGGAGSQKIVEYAKKGFDAVARKAPVAAGRWAKDTGADFLAQREFAQKRPGLQTLFRSTARPIEALKGVKKGYFDEPKKVMDKRFSDKFQDVANKWQPWGEDKLRPAKMLAWKLAGKNKPALLTQVGQLQEQLGILNDDERDKKAAQLEAAIQDKDRNQEILERMDGGKLGLFAANNEIKRLDELEKETEEAMLKQKDPIKKKELRDRSDELKERKEALGVAVAAATAADKTEVDIGDIKNAAGEAMFNKDDLAEVLQKQIDEADTLTAEIKPELDKDKALRDRYKIEKMDDDIRKGIKQEAANLTATAQKREWPYSKAVEKTEAAAVKEEQKELVDLDYEQLEDVYLTALKKNNVVQAKAAVKQMAENGQVSKLLESNGLGNNVEDLAKLISKDFKGTQRSQVQIIREVSNLSAKNGNNSLAYAVTSIKGGGGMLNNLQTQQNKLAEGKQKSIFDAKIDDLIYTDSAGNQNFNKGVVEKVLKPNNTETRSREVKKKFDPRVAAKVWEILDSQPELKQKLSPHLVDAIEEVRLRDS